MHHNHPELMKDVYWNQTVPSALPYTVETGKDMPYKNRTGSRKMLDLSLCNFMNFFYKNTVG